MVTTNSNCTWEPESLSLAGYQKLGLQLRQVGPFRIVCARPQTVSFNAVNWIVFLSESWGMDHFRRERVHLSKIAA